MPSDQNVYTHVYLNTGIQCPQIKRYVYPNTGIQCPQIKRYVYTNTGAQSSQIKRYVYTNTGFHVLRSKLFSNKILISILNDKCCNCAC